MEPRYSEEAEVYREKVQAFLAEHLPADWKGTGALEGEALERFTDDWRRTLYENGMLAQSWPQEYGGGGLSALEQVIVAEEFAKAGVPPGGPNDVFGIQMVGNTIIQWGTDEQKAHFLPRILSKADTWCQGYSEPNAGSDLANIGTRAVLDGDEWLINGQKIWTSAGHLADWIFVLARTDPEAPKHKGISFLLVPMDQPGVEVRPIKMISGESEFNEVFFTDARCAKEDVVGGVNNGWAVAMTLLGYERGEAAATMPIRFKGELDRLLQLAKEQGRADDPVIRQRLAWCYSKVEIMRYLGMRTLTKFLTGQHPGPDASISKLYWSEYHRTVTELAVDILGMDAQVPTGRKPSSAFQTDDAGAPNSSASWVSTFLNARAGTIYAGTSQIQRNIIGEMVLGLPKEPKPAEATRGAEPKPAEATRGAEPKPAEATRGAEPKPA
jgi:alkylation response protein AidB-like acyl-CoA dehydrogenase